MAAYSASIELCSKSSWRYSFVISLACIASMVLVLFQFAEHPAQQTAIYGNRMVCRPPSDSSFDSQFPGSEKLLNYREVWSNIYQPAGYCGCIETGKAQSPCWLRLYKTVNCRNSFQTYIETLRTHVPVIPPPRQLPPNLASAFLLNGYSQLGDWYLVEAQYAPDAQPPVWDSALLATYMNAASKRERYGNYPDQMEGLYHALSEHNISGLHGVVFGSNNPWLEGMLFTYGARQITTIEYRKTVSKIPNLTVITPLEWADGWLNGTMKEVDFAVTYSSLEHDGLGRYGDPLNPWGDIDSMTRASCYVKDGGMMILGVPSAVQDVIAYNAHRFYGPVRLPLLTANWQVLGIFTHDRAQKSDTCYGYWQFLSAAGTDYRGGANKYQPVVVLKNQRLHPCRG